MYQDAAVVVRIFLWLLDIIVQHKGGGGALP
jgi:hypothetical protein